MLAAALEARGEARAASSVGDVAATATTSERGFPSVSVPVLSTTSVSTCSSTSSASAFRIEHAGCGAAAGADHDRHRRREAERARTGDDQHGDGVDERVRQPRLGAERSPDARTSTTAIASTAGTNQADDTCRRGAGSARGCAAPRRPSARSAPAACRAPTRSARMTKPPVPLTVAAGDARSPAVFSTGIGSPVTIDSSTLLRPSSDDAVDRHLLAGPDAQAIADRTWSSGTSASLPSSARRRAPSSARDRAARGCARRSGCARAAPAPGRAAPASMITAAASK